MTRPDRFPKVNDVMLAEALRQLLPLAASGLTVTPTQTHEMPLGRARMVLDMWIRQEKGRAQKLDGPIPRLTYPELSMSTDTADPGQVIPAECVRPSRPHKRRSGVGPKPD